jgi:hypothetical protein
MLRRRRRSRTAAAVFAAALASAAVAHPPASLAVDGAGRVYYSDLDQVWRLDPDGSKRIVVARVHTHELWLDAGGALYGEHLWYEGDATGRWGHRVWRLGADGVLTDVVPARAGFRADTSFVRDAAGNQYWADPYTPGQASVIRRKSPSGAIAELARGDFGRIGWMSADAAGDLFFTAGGDRSRATSDLYRLRAGGGAERLARNLAEHRRLQFWVRGFHDVHGVWPDHRGGAYVALLGARLVKHVDAAGRVSVAVRSRFPWSPVAGALAADGTLWVQETGPTNRVRLRRIGAVEREEAY